MRSHSAVPSLIRAVVLVLVAWPSSLQKSAVGVAVRPRCVAVPQRMLPLTFFTIHRQSELRCSGLRGGGKGNGAEATRGPGLHSWGQEAAGALGEMGRERLEWEKKLAELLEAKNVSSHSSPRPSKNSTSTNNGTNSSTALSTRGWQFLPDRLQQFIAQQRALWRRGELDASRQSRLTAAGVKFKKEADDVEWGRLLARLQAFYKKHGHVEVGKVEGDEEHDELLVWVEEQKRRRARGCLSSQHLDALLHLPLDWRLQGREGERARCVELVLRRLRFGERLGGGGGVGGVGGSENASAAGAEGEGEAEGEAGPAAPLEFVRLARRQCNLLRLGVLSEADGKLLALAGAVPASKVDFSANWRRLLALRLHFGLSAPPEQPELFPAGAEALFPLAELVPWSRMVRVWARFGRWPFAHTRRLAMAGVHVKPRIARSEFRVRLAQLREFKRVHGHCSVPTTYRAVAGLARWVHAQRVRKRAGRLSASRTQRLERVGLTFEPRSVWEQKYAELVAFKARFGHCSPTQLGGNRQLGIWVAVQRVKSKKGHMLAARKAKLDAIGFLWTVHTEFEQRLEQLREYKAEHGHCNVPQQMTLSLNGDKYSAPRSLGTWVTMQRVKRKHGQISDEKIRQLDALGFQWGLNTAWDKRFRELIRFKEVHGHCNVPQKYPPNPSLGSWVAQQRRRYKSRTLRKDRVAMMVSAGLEWELKRGRSCEFRSKSVPQDEKFPIPEFLFRQVRSSSPRGPDGAADGVRKPRGAAENGGGVSQTPGPGPGGVQVGAEAGEGMEKVFGAAVPPASPVGVMKGKRTAVDAGAGEAMEEPAAM